ncbi:MAG: sigma-70 family RNA polymerase sigma factor [Bacteroidaceae bacterium]|nr:sigma-70 family RNA polymerase sigma factor [Bacteroidaceae bacterium]
MNNINTMTDHELVTLYENGNDNAFDILLARHQEYVYSYILFFVRKREDADDIFQETFTRAITAIREHRYQTTGKFNAWLIRIAHNLAIDHARSCTADLYSSRDAFSSKVLNNLKYSEKCQESQIIEQQNLDTLKQMLSYLPENQQEIVFLRFYEDLSFREIAEQKGISINTALGRMRYALINLRKMIQSHQISLVG